MTDNSTDATVDMNDLSNFSNVFFSDKAPAEEQEVQEEVAETEVEETEENDDSLATENEDEDNEEVEEEDDSDEEEEEEAPKPKPKSKAQKRIEQLYADKKQQEREIAAMRAELDRLKAVTEGKKETQEEEVPLRQKLSDEAPKPDAVDKDGNPVYALGEFDPQFIADLTKFTIQEQMKEAAAKQEAEARQKQVADAQAELQHMWQDNLAKAEESLPDIRESITELVDTFGNLEPTYGEYLAGTIMACEHGPEIMYYLSKNIGEAQKIVASGPAAATLAIGRLEARFEPRANEEKKSNKRLPTAKEPPEVRTRGARSGQVPVRGDTHDLAAFKREFFKD